MKKFLTIFFSLFILVPLNLNAGRGGAIAGGLIGGMALGSIMANANRPREEVVYVRDSYPQRPYYSQPVEEIEFVEEFRPEVIVLHKKKGRFYIKKSKYYIPVEVSKIDNQIYLQDDSGNYIKTQVRSMN